MLIYHLELLGPMLKKAYIKKLFVDLKKAGYDAITIEIADKLIFPSSKGFAAPDALDAKTWYDLIGYGIDQGLVIYPLIQTLGHFEYILNHDEYSYLMEDMGKPYLMCVSNSESLPFLYSLIEDLKSVFHNPKRIHLGGDEVQTAYRKKGITKCPICDKQDPHKMQVKHLSSLAKKALSLGMIPEVWGDDILRNPQSSIEFPKETVFVDWFYDRWEQFQDKTGHIWGHLDLVSKDTSIIEANLPENRKCIMPYILNEKGQFNNFYGLDYFIDNGFNTIVCSAARSGYDSFAVPRTISSIKNVSLSQKLSKEFGIDHMVSSWSIRRNHTETTWPAILAATSDDLSLTHLTSSIGGIPPRLENDLFIATTSLYATDHLSADDMRFNTPFYTEYLSYMKKYSLPDEFKTITDKLKSRVISANRLIEYLCETNTNSVVESRKAHYINGLRLIKLRCEEDIIVIRMYHGDDIKSNQLEDLLQKSYDLKKEFINLWSKSVTEHSLKQEVDIKFGYYERVIKSFINRI